MEPATDRSPLYLAATIDVQRAIDWLAEANAHRSVRDRLLLAALFMKGVAAALREVPELNATWADGESIPSPTVNLGVAVARHGGGTTLLVVQAADCRSLDDLMRDLRHGVRRARGGEPSQADGVPATFTVTSLGDHGVHCVFPAIVPPQLGGVGFGRVTEQPSAVCGAIVCSPVVTATLAADSRAIDGHRGARFLGALERRLQRPEAL